MISDELARQILDGKVKVVSAPVTSEYLAMPCRVFDTALSALAIKIEKARLAVARKFNTSGERYRFHIGDDAPRQQVETLVGFFRETDLAITQEPSFGRIF